MPNRSVRVLLIDDDADDALLIREMLGDARPERFRIDWVSSYEAGRSALQAQTHDVYLIDYRLGAETGLDLVRAAAADGCEAPLIVLTGLEDRDVDVAAMEAGAADYLVKGRLTVSLLERSIRYAWERKQAKERLLHQLAFTRTLTASLGEGLYSLDQEGRLTFLNPAAERLLGWTEAELLGQDMHERVHSQGRDGLPVRKEDCPLLAVLQSGQTVHQDDEVFLRKDGSLLPVAYTSAPLMTAGQITGAVLAFHDITERKQAEAVRAHLAALVESSDDAIIGKTLDGVIVSWNTGAARLYGYGPEEVIGQPIALLLPPDRPEEIAQILERIRRGERINRFETARMHKDGMIIPVSLTISPIYDVAGTITGASAIARDITERNQTQEALRLSEHTTRQRLQRLTALRAIDLAITGSVDLRSILEVVLEQVISQLGVDAASVLTLNRDTLDLTCAAARGFRGPAILGSRLRLGEGAAGRAALERRSLQITDLPGMEGFLRAALLVDEAFQSYSAVPLVAKGQVVGVLEIFHRGRLEQVDAEWHAFLEALAGQTAIAVDNVTLFDDVQRVNTDLRLAYDATISGWSRALDLRDHETEGHSQRVTEMTVRLSHALGVSSPDLVQMQRGALLHDIGKMGIPDNILLKAGPLSDEEWTIMRRHPVYAYDLLAPISFLRLALDIPYCHHEKWDGTGYPRGLVGEQIPLAARVFAVADVYDALRSDRPYRPGWSEERTLAHIRASAGTHFDPLVVAAFERLVTLPALLVVDDEPEIAEVLRDSLEDLYTVYTATSGAEALQLLAEHEVALILSDQRMPGITGIELLARAHAMQPEIVGLLFSAAPDTTTLAQALNLGMVRGFIPKPWHLDDLRARIQATLAGRGGLTRS